MNEQSPFTAIGNKKIKQKCATVCAFIQENRHKTFYICSHDNPDPDSLASAYGMYRILQFLGAEHIGIYYCGEISHPQNRAMTLVLNIPVKKWTKTSEETTKDNDAIFIYVDCSGKQKNMSIPFEPAIAFDHHKNIIANKNTILVHDDIGACSTLITDMILSIQGSDAGDHKVQCFDPEADNMGEIATALAIGIKTDTLDFRNETTTDDDYKAYKFLSKYIIDDKFNKIINYELPSYIFDCEQICWENKIAKPPNLVSGLGFIDDARGDCIPYLADKMMRLQGIQTVLIYAVVGNALRASVRTTSASLDCQSLLNDVFGEGFGGSKHGSGGAHVKFGMFDTCDMGEDQKNKFWDLIKYSIEKKFERATTK